MTDNIRAKQTNTSPVRNTSDSRVQKVTPSQTEFSFWFSRTARGQASFLRNFNKYKSFPSFSKYLVQEAVWTEFCILFASFFSLSLSLFALDAGREGRQTCSLLPNGIPFKIQREEEGTRYGGNVIIRPKCKTLFLRRPHMLQHLCSADCPSPLLRSPHTHTHTLLVTPLTHCTHCAAGGRAAISRRVSHSPAAAAAVRTFVSNIRHPSPPDWPLLVEEKKSTLLENR